MHIDDNGGVNIVLGVSGGIAAYKAVLIARQLIELGHEVHVIPTEDALKFVGLPTWEAISRNPVTTSVHDDVPEVRHVALGQRADLIIVAPATANTIAKMTAGLADDLLGTTLLATEAPVVIAPAMHTEMWRHPSTQHNIAVLRERGVHIVGPESGRLTGDDSGPGRMTEPADIVQHALGVLDGIVADPPVVLDESERAPGATPAQDLSGVRVLVTAGGTREPIDPVRFIGNRSSGKQGLAVAEAAAARGATVNLVAANIGDEVLDGLRHVDRVTITQVGSTGELQQATEAQAPASDVICMVAAVSDYRVREVSDGKMRKEEAAGDDVTLTLVENPDILRGLVVARDADESRSSQIIVGFAAETGQTVDDVIARGRAKRRRKGVDLLGVNQVGWHEGFETTHNTLTILGGNDETLAQVSGSKRDVADRLLDAVVRLRREQR